MVKVSQDFYSSQNGDNGWAPYYCNIFSCEETPSNRIHFSLQSTFEYVTFICKHYILSHIHEAYHRGISVREHLKGSNDPFVLNNAKWFLYWFIAKFGSQPILKNASSPI